MATRLFHCANCERPFHWSQEGGRLPKFCFGCRDPKNRARDLRLAKEKLARSQGLAPPPGAGPTASGPGVPTPSVAEIMMDAIEQADRDDKDNITRALAPQLLACALALTDDYGAAAALAGLSDLDPEELDRNIEVALEKHKDLTEGTVSGTVKVMSAILPILGIRALVNSRKVTPASAASAARAFAQVIEALSGGPKPVFSGPITLQLAQKAEATPKAEAKEPAKDQAKEAAKEPAKEPSKP